MLYFIKKNFIYFKNYYIILFLLIKIQLSKNSYNFIEKLINLKFNFIILIEKFK